MKKKSEHYLRENLFVKISTEIENVLQPLHQTRKKYKKNGIIK